MSTISPDEYFSRLHRVVATLDEANIKILQTMKGEGPRNLRNIARASKTPYATVYGRVARLERDGLLQTGIHPNYSRIGLSQANVMITPFLGKELLAREALRIPGYWLKIAACIGETNGYFAVVAIPSVKTISYEEYLQQLVNRGLIRRFHIFWLGESVSPIPNFRYFDMERKLWRFDWDGWYSMFKRQTKAHHAKEPGTSKLSFDKRDLLILKELMKDARVSLASLSKMLSITLPATKYRYDNLIERGLVHDHVVSMLPFSPEISELSEFRLDFRDSATRRTAEDVLGQLPFVLTYTPIGSMESISVRVYIPRMETRNLLATLSRLLRDQILAGYSYTQLDPTTLMWSTIGYKDFDDKTGWFYDNRRYLQQVDSLTNNWEKQASETTAGPPESFAMFH